MTDPSDDPDSASGNSFPETRTTLLHLAASGEWETFFTVYLKPMWHELKLQLHMFRRRDLDAEDLFSKFVLEIMRDGELKSLQRSLEDADRGKPNPVLPEDVYRGNVPARFLHYRAVSMKSAKFRTLVKRVICNVILKGNAIQQKQAKQMSDSVEASIAAPSHLSVSGDQERLCECIIQAVERFHGACRKSRTPGAKRLFRVLYLHLVENLTDAQIGEKFNLAHNTIAENRMAAIAMLKTKINEVLQPGEALSAEYLLRKHGGLLTAVFKLIAARHANDATD